MNYAMIRYIIGSILKIEAVFLGFTCIVSFIYRESAGISFFIVMLISFILGFFLSRKKPENTAIYAKEGFISVSLGWFLISFVGAFPYYLSGEITNFFDALFESVSGFTTTGISLLSDIETLSYTSLFWRNLTHWMGGMGVLVLLLSILRMTGGQHMTLMRAESTGPFIQKMVPRVGDTARILYAIYIGLTLLQTLILAICGLSWFDSITLSFSTAATGGFGISNAGLIAHAPHIQLIVALFMMLFGMNFNIFYLILRKRTKQAFASEELRVYLSIIGISTIFLALNTLHIFSSFALALKHSFFQSVSFLTSTGFYSTTYENWPQFSKLFLIILMTIGGCAGSTGGGIKVSRFIIVFKTIKRELMVLIHPRAIKKLTMDGHPIERETIRSVNIFFFCYLLIFISSVLIVSIDNHDFISNFLSITATINNAGPNLELSGSTSNFSDYSRLSQIVFMFNMMAGRLEIFPVLAFFMPATWRKR